MNEFDSLKKNYIAIIQLSLVMNVGCEKAKLGNDALHRFCESLIDNSCYPDYEKQYMKAELKIIKETLAMEISTFYQQH